MLIEKKFNFDFCLPGFNGENIKIKNKEKILKVEVSNNTTFSLNYHYHFLNNLQWKNFWAKLDQHNLWNWSDFYFDSTIDINIPEWELNLEKDGKSKKVLGCNYYPNNFDLFIKFINKIAKTSISNKDLYLDGIING